MKKYVKIQSTMNITVTGGLFANDVTNPDAHVPDRLKVQPLWPKTMVDIKEGVGYYPAEIAKWNTVKNLEKDKILTIGGEFDEIPSDEGAYAKLDNQIKELEDAMKEIEAVTKNKKDKRLKDTTLNDIAGE